MRAIVSLLLVTALALQVSQPLVLAQGTGTLNGTTEENVFVQLRNASNQLVSRTTSDAAGSFSFSGLDAGSYVVEIVNAAGEVIGVSSPISIAAGSTVAVTVTAAAGSVAGGGMGTAMLLTIITAAGGAGIGAVVLAKDPASPSN
jgi:hypothetical protein